MNSRQEAIDAAAGRRLATARANTARRSTFELRNIRRAAGLPVNNERAHIAARRIQQAFRSKQNHMRYKSQLLSSRGTLTNAELNKLVQIMNNNNKSRVNSPKNIVFFITKYPNKTNPNYLAKKKTFMSSLRRHRTEIVAKHGARIIQKAFTNRYINGIEKWMSKNKPTVNTPLFIKPVVPRVIASTRNANEFMLMVSRKSFNNKNFQNTLKSFKNYHAHSHLGSKINAAPEPPARLGTIREYMNAKKQYESNTRNWMKSMVRHVPWFKNNTLK